MESVAFRIGFAHQAIPLKPSVYLGIPNLWVDFGRVGRLHTNRGVYMGGGGGGSTSRGMGRLNPCACMCEATTMALKDTYTHTRKHRRRGDNDTCGDLNDDPRTFPECSNSQTATPDAWLGLGGMPWQGPTIREGQGDDPAAGSSMTLRGTWKS